MSSMMARTGSATLLLAPQEGRVHGHDRNRSLVKRGNLYRRFCRSTRPHAHNERVSRGVITGDIQAQREASRSNTDSAEDVAGANPAAAPTMEGAMSDEAYDEALAQEVEILRHKLADVRMQRDYWKAEAVWAAKEVCGLKVRVWCGIFETDRDDEAVDAALVKDETYQRAQAILKEAGDE